MRREKAVEVQISADHSSNRVSGIIQIRPRNSLELSCLSSLYTLEA